MAYQTLYP